MTHELENRVLVLQNQYQKIKRDKEMLERKMKELEEKDVEKIEMMERLKELEKKIKEKEEENEKLKNNEVIYNLDDYEKQLKKKEKRNEYNNYDNKKTNFSEYIKNRTHIKGEVTVDNYQKTSIVNLINPLEKENTEITKCKVYLDNKLSNYNIPFSDKGTFSIDYVFSEKLTNMSFMFHDCTYITTLDFTNFDVSNVTDMNCLFSGCWNLCDLTLGNFNTEKVINMRKMFKDCISFTWLKLNLNTNNVTDISYMFACCRELKTINISSFNTSKVINMSYLFGSSNYFHNSSLTSLDLSNFDTSNVTNMEKMFFGCESLKT
jgi:surface protein